MLLKPAVLKDSVCGYVAPFFLVIAISVVKKRQNAGTYMLLCTLSLYVNTIVEHPQWHADVELLGAGEWWPEAPTPAGTVTKRDYLLALGET